MVALAALLVAVGALWGPWPPIESRGSYPGDVIGSVFTVGNPTLSPRCPTGGTIATIGCSSGDYHYTLTIESSTVAFDQVLFRVDSPNERVFEAAGGPPGFSIDFNSTVEAYWVATPGLMTMVSGWTFEGNVVGATPLTNLYEITIDMGATHPAELGYTFIAVGTNGNSETTAPLALP